MKKTTWWIIIIVVLILVALGIWYYWWWMQKTGGYGTPTTNVNQPTTTTGATVTIAHGTTLGDYLVAANGMTLYRYTKDTANTSNCTGQCPALWTAYTVTNSASVKAGAGVTGTLSTFTRPDGKIQVTYNQQPLYLFSGDKVLGDTNGQNFNGFWFVVNP